MITHEKATDKNIITKQVVINTPTSARLLPITADEKVIDKIQQALDELERLKKFKETFDNYELAKKQDFIAYENWLECEAELKKSPTADEVCKALSEYFGEEVIFLVNDKEFVIKCNIGYKYIVETDDVLYYIKVGLPLYLITLIGRFYEGVTG